MQNSASNQVTNSSATMTTLGLVAAMVYVVVLSNVLVQYPLNAEIGGVQMKDLLTLGAFTYPLAFFVTDATNRHFGPGKARLVVLAGFAIAVLWSIWLATPRIAIASGSAFLIAQMLDVSVFNRLRKTAWWLAPLVSSVIGSIVDTVLFFGIAFAPMFNALDFGGKDGSLAFGVPFLGIGSEVPLWISLAMGDFIVKILISLAMLLPYAVVAKRPATATT